MHPSPAAVYAERLATRQAAAAAIRGRLDKLSYARLAAFLAAVVTAGVALAAHLFSPFWIAVPVAVFLLLVAKFEAGRGRLTWNERAARFYRSGLARLGGQPEASADGSRFANEDHPYAADLDLFGPGSVFERLNCCRTRVGEDTLAAWLLEPAVPAEVAARQAAVADLTPRLDLRESLACAGSSPSGTDYTQLAAWGAAPCEAVSPWKRWAVEVLGWGNVLALIGWLFVGTTSIPVAVLALISVVIALPLGAWVRRSLAPVEQAEAALSLLEAVLIRLEREPVSAPRLRELQAAMRADGLPASAQTAELRAIVIGLNARKNAFFFPVALLRMWGVRYAFKFEAWRKRSGGVLRAWLRAVGEAEALSSLAGYAYENPADVFPVVVEAPPSAPSPGKEAGDSEASASLAGNCAGGAGAPFFHAVALGHPLMPPGACVPNDVTLGGEAGPRVFVISGSNMSGKSTLLRSVGVNVVFALAGGVVRAKELTLTPVALGATMRVQDSLQAGRSRFFAEVTKVRHLLDLATANAPPLLFLLDELFSGTNSADRVAGAERVIRAMLEAGAVGLVTTHDLALTAVTDRLPGAVNVHFCDGFAGGELRFDYTMRPGVVPHGNGLALMRAVGLRV